MIASGYSWRRRQISAWSARADALRAAGGRRELNCALGLDEIVAGLRRQQHAAEQREAADREPVAHPPMTVLPPIGGLRNPTSWRGHWGRPDMDPPLREWHRLEALRLDELAVRLRLHGGRVSSAWLLPRIDAAERAAAAHRGRADELQLLETPSPPPMPAPFTAGPQMSLTL